jgi:hypothetical protein
MNARAEKSLHDPTICPTSNLLQLLEIPFRSLKLLQIVTSVVTVYSGVGLTGLPADYVLLIALAFKNTGVAQTKNDAGVASRKICEPLG